MTKKRRSQPSPNKLLLAKLQAGAEATRNRSHALKDVETPEVLAFLEQARRNDGPSAPRKHHLVPGSYLRRWTENDQIRVTDINTCNTYTTSPAKAARETDYYRIESEDVDPKEIPPLLFETILSQVEGWGKQAVDALFDSATMGDRL